MPFFSLSTMFQLTFIVLRFFSLSAQSQLILLVFLLIAILNSIFTKRNYKNQLKTATAQQYLQSKTTS